MISFGALRALGVGECALLSEAMLGLAIASLSLKFLPFRRVAAFASRPLKRRRPGESEEAAIIVEVRWAVRASSRRAPWRAKCFEQGLTAVWMLRRRGIVATLHYGMARNEESGLKAHVWVRAGEQDVIGCATASAFNEVARFPAQI